VSVLHSFAWFVSELIIRRSRIFHRTIGDFFVFGPPSFFSFLETFVVAVGAVDVALFSEDVLSNGEFHQLSTSFSLLQSEAISCPC
jgi:hypothetical protein